ncbi:MAG: MerR family transcriptional regulator [Elusimicrobiota bacterium]
MADPHAELSEPLLSIGTLAEKTGVSVSSIRNYEVEGLLIPHRMPSGHRLFSREDIARVKTIQHMIKDQGMNMEGIRRLQALLPCWDLVRCSKTKRSSCAAKTDTAKPCWMIRGGNCSPKGNECRSCVVYRLGSRRTNDIKRLISDRSRAEDLYITAKSILEEEETPPPGAI